MDDSAQRGAGAGFFAVRFSYLRTWICLFVVHTRDALEDTYEIIKSEGVGPRGGIMHSFSGTLEWAEKFVALGMTISFSGVVTFKKATDIQEAAKELPLDKILVETDAPYFGSCS